MRKIIFGIAIISIIFVFSVLSCISSRNAEVTTFNPQRISIEDKISQMIILGYTNEVTLNKLLSDLSKDKISGVILYKRNIKSPKELRLTTSKVLKASNKIKPFIVIDQEGGQVSRISSKNGFKYYPSAEYISKNKNETETYQIYSDMAKTMKKYNINLNLAPCVDIKTTEKSSVGKNERTYGNNYKQVNIYAKEFVKAHYDNGVIPVLKHFPGIGNAELDTHKGLPDISSTWTEDELLPFKNILSEYSQTPVMVAHVKNNKLDEKNLVAFSPDALGILSKQYNHNGLIIMDAVDMNALAGRDIDDIIISAVNAGVNLFIFPNSSGENTNPDKYMTSDKFLEIILKAIQNNKIDEQKIDISFDKIMNLKKQIKRGSDV